MTIARASVTGRRGANTLQLVGRLVHAKVLVPGSYRLAAHPIDAAHHAGREHTVSLTLGR